MLQWFHCHNAVMGSAINSNNSGGINRQHIVDYHGWVQQVLQTMENHRNHYFWHRRLHRNSNLTHLSLDKIATTLADDIFKCIYLNENDRIPIQISLKFVPRSPIVNKPALVQVMAWRRIGPIHWRIYAALGGVELSHHWFRWWLPPARR